MCQDQAMHRVVVLALPGVVPFELAIPARLFGAARDTNGEPLYAVQVVALAEGGAEIIAVKVAGEPSVAQGAMLAIHALVASPWSMGDRSGVAFRASRIEPASSASGRAAARAES